MLDMFKLSDNAKKEIKSTLFIIFLILIFRTFVASPYKIPSESMVPTLLVNDYIFTTKFDYNLKIPYTGLSLKVGQPKRGDVVCFDFPEDLSLTYIKRIIGLPGDEISVIDDDLFINGKIISHKLRGEWGVEDLSGVKHLIVMGNDHSLSGGIVVPSESYFAMGDNRPNSYDSRFWGFVSQDKLIGKARFIWLSYDGWSIRFSRMFSLVE